MNEPIRYSLGHSSLGDFIAAMSNEGLVAFEFAERPEGVLQALRARLPDAEITRDEAGLAEIVAKLADVVERPDLDPGIPLDIRGSDYQKKVWDLLRHISAGETMSYGAIAAEMGTPRDARDVTEAIANNAIAILIPCHRIVKKDGSLSGYRWGTRRKRALLVRERNLSGFRLVS